jgi:hypothetical protein
MQYVDWFYIAMLWDCGCLLKTRAIAFTGAHPLPRRTSDVLKLFGLIFTTVLMEDKRQVDQVVVKQRLGSVVAATL